MLERVFAAADIERVAVGDKGSAAALFDEIGDDLGLPYELTHKVPIDGLQPLSDEEKFGFSYHEINELIRKGIRGEHYDKIMKMFNAGKFKLEMIKIQKFDPKLPDYFLENFGI